MLRIAATGKASKRDPDLVVVVIHYNPSVLVLGLARPFRSAYRALESGNSAKLHLDSGHFWDRACNQSEH
jgi:hypothetical protein